MKVALLLSLAWCRSSQNSRVGGDIVSLLAEGLASSGSDVTLFIDGGLNTSASLDGQCRLIHEGNMRNSPKVQKCLHLSEMFEQADCFDIIHTYYDFLPLTYLSMTATPVVTTVPEFLNPDLLPLYKKFNKKAFYVAESEDGKSPGLDYMATVHPGIDLRKVAFQAQKGTYLLFLGRMTQESGVRECIDAASRMGKQLLLIGNIEDGLFFDRHIQPHLDDGDIIHISTVEPDKWDELLGGAYALLQPGYGQDPGECFLTEALARGTPVIALNRGNISEIVDDGITGFLIDDLAELAGAIAKIEHIDRFQCRKSIETRFSADRMVQNYIAVYEKIIQRTRRENHRPWGFYEIFSEAPDHKVKRITVYPGQRLSYQRHYRRAEHWYVISGKAVVTRSGKDIELRAGQAVDLPVEIWHRIWNPGPEDLIFIEIQTGDDFDEGDVERLEDDYGRVSEKGVA